MKALMAVAHPDDCVIFGHHFYDRYRHLDWKIIYLTYDRDHPRAQQYINYWQGLGVETEFLGYPDIWEEVSQGRLGFDREDAAQDLQAYAWEADLLLTHNAKGEYGHPHHVMIHEILRELDMPKVWFGSYPDISNLILRSPEPLFDPSRFPIDEAVIRGFDLTLSTYFLTPEAESVLHYRHERNT